MNNNKQIRETIIKVIANSLSIDISTVTNELTVGSIPEWDSLAHVELIAAVEKEFNIQFEIDQVFELEEVEDFIDIVNEILG